MKCIPPSKSHMKLLIDDKENDEESFKRLFTHSLDRSPKHSSDNSSELSQSIECIEKSKQILDTISSDIILCPFKNIYCGSFDSNFWNIHGPKIVDEYQVQIIFNIAEEPLNFTLEDFRNKTLRQYYLKLKYGLLDNLLYRFGAFCALADDAVEQNKPILVRCAYQFQVSMAFIIAYTMHKYRKDFHSKIELIWSIEKRFLMKIRLPNYTIGPLNYFYNMRSNVDLSDHRYRFWAYYLFQKRMFPLLMNNVNIHFFNYANIGWCEDYFVKGRVEPEILEQFYSYRTYDCSTCGESLFSEMNIIKDESWHTKDQWVDCETFIVEPMVWMFYNSHIPDFNLKCSVASETDSSVTYRRLNYIECPKCPAVIGYFNMFGIECSNMKKYNKCMKHVERHLSNFVIFNHSVRCNNEIGIPDTKANYCKFWGDFIVIENEDQDEIGDNGNSTYSTNVNEDDDNEQSDYDYYDGDVTMEDDDEQNNEVSMEFDNKSI